MNKNINIAAVEKDLTNNGFPHFRIEKVCSQIKKAFAAGKESALFQIQRGFRQGVLSYLFGCLADSHDGLVIVPQRWQLTRYPDFSHRVIDDVDSQLLESTMATVGSKLPLWDQRLLMDLFEGRNQYTPAHAAPLENIARSLREISGDPAGRHIAQLLKHKYWFNLDRLSHSIDHDIIEQVNEMPSVSFHLFPRQIDSEHAYNLLCGRAVYGISEDAPWCWLRLKIDPTGQPVAFLPVDGYTTAKLAKDVAAIPIELNINNRPVHNDYWGPPISNLAKQLENGNLVEVSLANGTIALLEADPVLKKIVAYDRHLKQMELEIKRGNSIPKKPPGSRRNAGP